jgi:hypothetical protein
MKYIKRNIALLDVEGVPAKVLDYSLIPSAHEEPIRKDILRFTIHQILSSENLLLTNCT